MCIGLFGILGVTRIDNSVNLQLKKWNWFEKTWWTYFWDVALILADKLFFPHPELRYLFCYFCNYVKKSCVPFLHHFCRYFNKRISNCARQSMKFSWILASQTLKFERGKNRLLVDVHCKSLVKPLQRLVCFCRPRRTF